MASQATTFGLSMVLNAVGLAIMLYGMSLNAGQALNNVILAGGVVMLAATGIMTGALLSIDGGESTH